MLRCLGKNSRKYKQKKSMRRMSVDMTEKNKSPNDSVASVSGCLVGYDSAPESQDNRSANLECDSVLAEVGCLFEQTPAFSKPLKTKKHKRTVG